jgi:putative glutamine amidotransferase
MKVLVSCSNEERGQPYLEALRAVGVADEAIHLVTPARVVPEDAAALAAGAAGLLLCGGPDVEPHRYGEEPHPNANLGLMPERDAVELELLAGAREAKTPTFGVCRGLQTTNVFLGGTLWQDLELMWPHAVLHNLSFPRDAMIHTIEVTPGTTELGDLLGRELSLVNQSAEPQVRSDVGEKRPDRGTILVNSRHHQAIKELAPGLEVVAVAPDGIVEAMAGRDREWWLWGVQWHPENLVSMASQRVLFERFRAQVEARAWQLGERRVPAEPVLR